MDLKESNREWLVGWCGASEEQYGERKTAVNTGRTAHTQNAGATDKGRCRHCIGDGAGISGVPEANHEAPPVLFHDYSKIFDNSPAGIFRMDLDGRFLLVNPAFARMAGYESPEEFMNTAVEAGGEFCVRSIDRRKLINGAPTSAGSAPFRLEASVRCKDGSVKYADLAVRLAIGDNGAPCCMDGLAEDITDRKRTEDELRRSERRFRRVVELSPEAIFIIHDGKIALANTAAGKLLGAANPGLLLGRSIFRVVHPDYRNTAERQMNVISEKECEIPIQEQAFLSIDGFSVPVEVSAIPFVFEGRQSIQWVAHDLSKRKRSEEALERQNAYLTALNETAIGLLGRLDLNGLLKAIVARAAALVDAPNGFLYLYNEDNGYLEMVVALGSYEKRIGYRMRCGEGLVGKVLAAGKPLFVEDYRNWEYRLPDPRLDPIRSAVGVPLFLESRVIGIIGLGYHICIRPFGDDEIALMSRFAELASIALDNARLCAKLQKELSERNAIEIELMRAKDAAETANRAKSEFLAKMSHELRTPLNAVIGFTELIVDRKIGDLNETQADYLGDVLVSARHLLSLINDILDLSKVEAGKLELSLSNVCLGDLITGSLFMVKEKAASNNVTLAMDIEGISDIHVTADGRRFKQIMYNLLYNAVKFTPRGGKVRLSARIAMGAPGPVPLDTEATSHACSRRAPDDAGKGRMSRDADKHVEISVSDTGIGIKSEDLERIFNPFEQVDGAANRKYDGTGLGLALTRQLAELHGGKIWAESEGMGKGSTFRFTIPL